MIINHKPANKAATRRRLLIITSMLLFTCCHRSNVDTARTDRKKDGIAGPARSVRTETSKLTRQSGDYIEGPREVVETKTYGSDGNAAEESYTAVNDALLYTARYAYDDGRKIERVIHDPNGTIRTKRVFKYDDKGNLAEYSDLDANDSLHSKSAYAYDDKHNLVEWTTFNAKGALVDRWAYAYDDKGNKKEETRYFADDSVDTRYVYELDEKGNRLETTKYNAKGEVVGKEKYTYEFDSNDNWIKRTTIRLVDNGGKSEAEPVEVTYRKIVY